MMPSIEIRPERRRQVASKAEMMDNYNCRFAVISANTLGLQEQAYRLRYQVYCIENNFENPLDHPLEQEMDEFDNRSVHSVLIDRPNRAVVGTVRLILPDPKSIEESFPIQRVCNHPLLQRYGLLNVERSAEISRFAISKTFCRRAEDYHPILLSRDEMRAAMPNLTLGLLNGIVRMSAENGISDWFAVMEPTLLRLLARFGIYFSPIGPMVDYHGMRQPCHAVMSNLLERVRKERPEVWEIITDNGSLLDKEDRPFASFRLIN